MPFENMKKGDRGDGLPAAKLMMVGSVSDLKISRMAEGFRAASLSEILYSMAQDHLVLRKILSHFVILP